MLQQATRPTRASRDSVDELLSGASAREPMMSIDAKSGATFERATIAGQPYVVKHVDPHTDWISRWTGDYGPRVVTMWRAGLLDALPSCIDHAIEAVAQDTGTRASTLLMRDVGEHLMPTDGVWPVHDHLQLLDHMAELHAHFWGFDDTLGLLPMDARYTLLSPHMSRFEIELGELASVPAMIPGCWDELDLAAPQATAIARGLAGDPWPLVLALAETPRTLLHGDWKAGNLGSLPDGRTLLLDWGMPGAGPPCADLAWYLAVNCDLLPGTKDSAIEAYRAALERRRVTTSEWWDRQLELSLLGAFVQLGWSKTHDPDELGWWAERAVHATRYLR